jgi:predicted transcriptional regulator
MQKTKLETYVDVLKILAQNNLLKTSNVADALNISSNELEKYFAFLFKLSLIEERKLSNSKCVYLITQRGIRVLKHFKELKQELPIIGDSEYKGAPTSFSWVN